MNTQILARHFSAVLVSFLTSLILAVPVAQAAPPGYTYEVLWEGANNQNFPTEEAYCPGAAINNRGAVVFRTGQFVSFYPAYVEQIRVYLAERGQAPTLIYETFTNNADPLPSGISCRIGGLGGLGINDNGIVAVQAQWVDVDEVGNIVATNDYGFVLIQPGVGVIRELRGLMTSTGRVNNNLQMAGTEGAALVLTDGITTQSSPLPLNNGVGFGYVNVNSSGTVAAGGVTGNSSSNTSWTTIYRAAPPGPLDTVLLGNFIDIGHTTFYTPGINDLGWTSFSTNTDGNYVNPNPRILLISPEGSIFSVAEANGSEFENFFQGGVSAEWAFGTSLNNFNRVSFLAQLDGELYGKSVIYVGDASGDPPRLAVDKENDIALANGNSVQMADVVDHGVNSMNDAGEVAVSVFGNKYDSTGEFLGQREIVLVSRPVPGMEPGSPIIPDPADALPGGGWLIWLTCGGAPPRLPITHCVAPGGSGSSTSRTFVDPPIAVGYDYEMDESSEGSFTSVLVPVPLAGGDANFTVEWFNGNSAAITAGTVFEFASVSGDPAGNPVRQFRISGIDPGEALNPDDPTAFVLGLTFAGDTTTEIVFTMTPVVDDTTDSDGDGIGDSLDNCPAIPNANQLDGDQDGVGDACDVCPATAIGATVDRDGCSEAQKDDDGDGVANGTDLCPGTVLGAVVDANGCSEAQKDDDGDGVANSIDLCPGTVLGAAVDANGCSDAQKDDDGDGVANATDLCPGTVLGAAVDTNGCSEAQKDDDGDGVFNNVDLCPGTLPGTVVGSDGCPVIQQGRVCDVDLDNDVDYRDINLIFGSFWQPASGPNDPRDANHNGRIDLRDALICTKACDLRFCKSP